MSLPPKQASSSTSSSLSAPLVGGDLLANIPEIAAMASWQGAQQVVRINATGIYLQDVFLSADDVSGIQEGQSSTIHVHSYPYNTARCAGSRYRAYKRHDLFFSERNQDFLNITRNWKTIWSRKDGMRYMVLVNPFGGQRKGGEIFNEVVKPMLLQSNSRFEAVFTTHAGHACEVAAALSLAEYDGIILVGGDGLVSELVQGLLSRLDSDQASRVPIGIVPAGTGNGLVKSLLSTAGEQHDPVTAMLAILRCRPNTLDVGLVIQDGVVKYRTILSWAWGLVSDSDIEADALRCCCGPIRATLQGVVNIFRRRIYNGTLRLRLSPSEENSSPQEWVTITDRFLLIWAMNVPYAASDLQVAPRASHDDGSFDVVVIRSRVSRLQMIQIFLEVESGKHLRHEYVEYYKVREMVWEPACDKGMVCIDGELAAVPDQSRAGLPRMHQDKDLPMSYSAMRMQVSSGLLSCWMP